MALKNYIDDWPIKFHMPGHKGGYGIDEELLKDIYKYDLTELDGLDNLHVPSGCIKIAQEMAARDFGSKEHTFWLMGQQLELFHQL